MLGSALWSGALLTTAVGVHHHSLPMLYLGYGILGGMGWGFLYLTPVTSVMKWFPDKRGLATGIALSAFGAGAALAPSLIHALVDWFAISPEFVGECVLTGGGVGECVELSVLGDGSQVVALNSPVGVPGTPVVVATEADIAKVVGTMGSEGPGVYAIGTGNTGVAKAMGTLGVVYGCLGAIGSRFMMIPHPEWSPDQTRGTDKVATKNAQVNSTTNSGPSTNVEDSNNTLGLPASYVTTNTSQFPLLWLSVFGYATGGLALLSSSKIMLTDIFAGVAPQIVTPAFSTGYVSALGIGMALGRFGWSAISDVIGRKNAYALFGFG
jgi:MFS family permease